MCDAWLLQPRHGPDGARVHTGYAYGTTGRRVQPEGAQTPAPPLLYSRRPEPVHARVPALPQPYAHQFGAREVTRLPRSIVVPELSYSQNANQQPLFALVLFARGEGIRARSRENRKGRSARGGVAVGASDGVFAGFIGFSRVICDGCLHPTAVSIIRAATCHYRRSRAAPR